VVVTGDDAPGRAKPLPDLYLLAAARLKVDHTQCVAIEDSRNGIAAAQAAGMTCIALSTELNQSQDLSAADLTVTHMDQIDVASL
jgi:beta-phosphoglucomutase-like phosphatase (HAD superfamily)